MYKTIQKSKEVVLGILDAPNAIYVVLMIGSLPAIRAAALV